MGAIIHRIRQRLAYIIAPAGTLFSAEMSREVDRLALELEECRQRLAELEGEL